MKTTHQTKITFGIRLSAPERKFHRPIIAGTADNIIRRATQIALLCGCLIAATVAVRAETLFAPGTINIATNQAIVITTPPYLDSSGYAVDFDLDGVPMQFNTPWPNGQYWIAGPHSLTLTNRCFVTFQRLEGSALKTVVCLTPSTNSIHVPVGKTIQLLRGTVNASLQTVAVSTNSPDPYPVNFGLWGAALSGPCDISLIQGDSGGNPLFVSYYFTGEVL